MMPMFGGDEDLGLETCFNPWEAVLGIGPDEGGGDEGRSWFDDFDPFGGLFADEEEESPFGDLFGGDLFGGDLFGGDLFGGDLFGGTDESALQEVFGGGMSLVDQLQCAEIFAE